MSHTRELAAEGHLIDTGLMSKYLDIVLEHGGPYELIRFDIGRTVGDFSRLEMTVPAPDEALLAQILENLVALGCHLVAVSEQVVLRPSAKDGTVPDDFYSTSNHRTRVRALEGAELVLILGTMLHGIGVGNMTPSWVRTVCVDINPAMVTRLVDRGSAQASGIVTDVGLFLRLLADEVERGPGA